MKIDDGRFLALALAIPAVQTYSVFLPSIYEVERAQQAEEAKRSVATNLYICDGIVVLAGIITAIYVGESVPLWVALFVATYMTAAYMTALQTEQPKGTEDGAAGSTSAGTVATP